MPNLRPCLYFCCARQLNEMRHYSYGSPFTSPAAPFMSPFWVINLSSAVSHYYIWSTFILPSLSGLIHSHIVTILSVADTHLCFFFTSASHNTGIHDYSVKNYVHLPEVNVTAPKPNNLISSPNQKEFSETSLNPNF